MVNLTEDEVFAVSVRRAVVEVTQTYGTSGYPKLTYEEPPFVLRLGMDEEGPCWYCPFLFGTQLVRLLAQARGKGTDI